MYGIEILKKSFMLAYQTTRTLVTIAVPRFPWSLDRFQTPFATLTISSFGKTFNFLSSVRIELLNFRSRYIFEVEYALNMKSTMILSKNYFHWIIRINQFNYNIVITLSSLLEHSDNWCEKSWCLWHKISKDEFKPGVIAFS